MARGFERVDLLGHLHRAELGADARADPSREQKPGCKGSGFTHERNGQARRNHGFRAESFQRGPGVHGEDDADGHARDGNQRGGPQAQLEDLADRFAELERRRERLAGRPPREDGQVANRRQRGHHQRHEPVEHAG